MFYFLSKVLFYLLTPAGLVVMALIVAAWTKNHARRRRAIGVALAGLFLFGNGFLTNEAALWWEYPPVTLPAASGPRVGVVLTGGMVKVTSEPKNRIYLGDQADRLGQALLLYKGGQIQKILISGGIGSILPHDRIDEGQTVARFLRTAGVPAQDIWLENHSRNTHENALFSAPILQKQFRNYGYVLITSAWHMRRAVGCFRKQGIAVTPYPAALLSQQRTLNPGQWLPSEMALLDSYWLLHEWIGYATYWAVGYL